MPKINPENAPARNQSSYPAPHAKAMARRWVQRVGDLGGLTQFGVNLVRLEPGGLSSLRHWHEKEDEFVFVTEGELTLVEDGGETLLNAGDMAAFKAGSGDGHHLLNRSDRIARFLVVGTRARDETAHYSDADLVYHRKDGRGWFTRRNGKFLKEA
jgi:uncharacterized cupin superfamily protein